MKWLRRVQQADDRAMLNFRRPDNTEQWRQWAVEHGWTYQAEAPELVGRYLAPYETGAERYDNLLTTTMQSIGLTAFEHSFAHHYTNSGAREGAVTGYLVIHLPGAPPASLTMTDAEHAIRNLGGCIPEGTRVEFRNNDLILQRSGFMKPLQLQGDAELMTAQLALLPASFWGPV